MYTRNRNVANPYNKVRILYLYGPLPRFGGLTLIGTLAKINEKYTFDYALNDMAMVTRPLRELPSVHNETTTLNHWYFFSKRIPPLNRPDVVEVIEKDGLDVTKPLTMLAVFGAQIIQDNRILVASL